MKNPDPEKIFPVPGIETVTYIKPAVKNPNIIAGEFSYYAGKNFEFQVKHHYDFIGDKLIIGKFCQIAEGAQFIMNGANHQMNCASTFPFYIFEGWQKHAKTPELSELPLKGDTIIGNDVWIGQNATIMPGVHIGDGAIIGMNSTVAKNIPPYSIAAGNPARVIKKRFDDELRNLMLKLKWWDRSIDEIKKLIPVITCNNLEKIKNEIKNYLDGLTE